MERLASRPIVVSTAIILLSLAGFAAYSLGRGLSSKGAVTEIVGTAFQNPIDVSDVSLKTAGDENVSLGEFKDKVTLVFFGFTRCPDTCPITLGRLAQAYEDMGKPDDLEVVMITVDPDFDTPDITHAYTSGYHEDFIGLSGSNAEVADVMSRFFVAAANLGTAEFFHTDVVFVLNRDAKIKYLYGQDKMQELPDNVQTLMANSNW